ncbi:MAG: 16S rRNA (cytidine(1402)-2'-O)-methyltransferase [Acidobacteria bacterium]|nr:16S rRNA (cytidine(1402)-2'-O)-methyltransferase [Acidobacteriota bacterium]
MKIPPADPSAETAVLHVVATPIGNLGDLTLRALETLRAAELVICEDTRRTGRLLQHYGVGAPRVSHHDFNERESARRLADRIAGGLRAALVTDAGTPAVSDPGTALVRECLARGVRVVPVPGVSAVTAALSVSHLSPSPYLFLGFAPPRGPARRRFLETVRDLPWTLVFYEAPHRVLAFLGDLQAVLGDREALFCRELTKLHEEVLRMKTSALREALAGRERVVGEITLAVAGAALPDARASAGSAPDPAACLAALDGKGLSNRDVAAILSRLCGIPRNEAYRMAGRRR